MPMESWKLILRRLIAGGLIAGLLSSAVEYLVRDELTISVALWVVLMTAILRPVTHRTATVPQ